MIAADHMPAAELPRPRTLLVGTVFAIVACGMFFAGAFGVYLKERNDVVTSGGEWLKKNQISLVPGCMMMVTAASPSSRPVRRDVLSTSGVARRMDSIRPTTRFVS